MTLFFASLAFFLSGFAALVYQIAWQRLLVLPVGADVYSTTIIVTAFMAGLGFGSLAGGHLADRLSWFQNLVMFVVAEVAVGAFGLVSRYVFYDWQYLQLSSLALSSGATVAILFFSLLWPTFWMGVSLPLLARAVSSRLRDASRRVGVLYGLNTLGAAVGAFTSTWILLPRTGLDGGIRIAALLNFAAAAAVLAIVALLWQRRDAASEGDGAVAPSALPPTAAADPALGWRFSTWMWLYGLAGFQALSLEILWFRLLGVMLKSSAFTFGTLLTIYLAGLGLGASLASLFLKRVRRPALVFLLLQGFIGLYAIVGITIMASQLPSGTLSIFRVYFAEYEPLDAAAAFWNLVAGTPDDPITRLRFVMLYVVLPTALVGPPTLAMGASFAMIQNIVLVDLQHIGRRVGHVLVANIAGSVIGSLLTGWLALTWLGSATSLKLLAATSGALLVMAALTVSARWTAARRGALVIATVMLVAGAMALGPDSLQLGARLHGSPLRAITHEEDASGLSVLKAEVNNFGSRAIVFVNGIGQSWIPYGNVHTILGALPAFIHPEPRTAALIGLGSGDTLYSLAGRQELSSVTSVEIIRPQLDTLRRWERQSGYPALTALLADPRIEHVFGDGRIHIMRSGRTYDIIEADALRPTSAYSGNLYSVGYFELVRSRLTANGLAVTWAPTPRIHDTFVSVFPHVLDFGDIVVGSNAPIAFDPAVIRARLQAPAVKAYFDRAAIDIAALLAPYIDGTPRTITAGDRAADRRDLNEDLFPRDEFNVTRLTR